MTGVKCPTSNQAEVNLSFSNVSRLSTDQFETNRNEGFLIEDF